MDSHVHSIEANASEYAERVNDADNQRPLSDARSIAVSSTGDSSISASGNEQHTVNTLHARIEALELDLGTRVRVLESKAVDGMAKLDAIQQDIKQYMVNQQAYMANQQARYEPVGYDPPNIFGNSLFVLFSDMNRSMKGRLFPLLDSTGKIPTDFPANAADLTRLSGTIDMTLYSFMHFLIADTCFFHFQKKFWADSLLVTVWRKKD